MKKLLNLFVCTSILLSGCATEPVVTDVPTSPTNVLTADYSITGIVLPDATGTQRVLTREDRRRIDAKTKFNSWVSRRIFGSPDTSLIGRTDLSLSWHMNNKRETYHECGLLFCTDFWSQFSTQSSEEEEEYYEPVDETCKTEVASYDFGVTELDKQRNVNGFIANRYEAKWTLELEDEEDRVDTNELVMDFWMIEPTDDMREGWRINEAFHRNVEAKLKEQHPLSRFVGGRVYMALAAFTGDIEKTEDHALNADTSALAAIPGYPVSIKLEWNTERNTCPAPKEAESELDWSDPKSALGGLASGFAKKTVKNKFWPKPDEPILRYIYDVKSSDIQDIADNEFQVPSDYKLIDRD